MLRNMFVFVSFTVFAMACAGEDASNEKPNTPPTADAHLRPSNPAPGETVTVDATKSIDPDGDPLEYRIRVENPSGDVITQTRGRSSVKVRLEESGTYAVRVTATDVAGAESERTVEFQTVNRPPTANVRWRLSNDDGEPLVTGGGENSGLVATTESASELRARFDRIEDPDGHETTVHWEVRSSPNQLDNVELESNRWRSTFDTPGNYEIHGIIRDDYGATTDVAFDITLQE